MLNIVPALPALVIIFYIETWLRRIAAVPTEEGEGPIPPLPVCAVLVLTLVPGFVLASHFDLDFWRLMIHYVIYAVIVELIMAFSYFAILTTILLGIKDATNKDKEIIRTMRSGSIKILVWSAVILLVIAVLTPALLWEVVVILFASGIVLGAILVGIDYLIFDPTKPY